MVSNKELKNTKPSWTLSKDKLTYTKVFTQNQTYQTPVEDINGHIINANIKIDQITWKQTFMFQATSGWKNHIEL